MVETMNPKHPVYIISKGRWEHRLTSRALHRMGVRHFVVVEAQEHDRYRAALDTSATTLVLDPAYQRDYQTCDDLGDSKSKGPGPARNFAWDHSIALGASWHWVMDDNMNRFYRLHHNRKISLADGAALRAMEDFAGRYENVLMAGPQYEMFVPRRTKVPPFRVNTRIYSCNLIRNDAPYRWRGRYNEDTILSLRMLKDGWCTILFNAFLAQKAGTQTVEGGNTAEFYAWEGTLPKSEMLARLFPDIAKVVWRFNRWHHHVDYSGFTQPLQRHHGLEVPQGTNEYGMVHQRLTPAGWVPTA
jgi:hypothetical protein